MLQIGQSATFRGYNGRLVYGKVVSITAPGVYIVASVPICRTYSDGLYRFTDRNIVS